MTTGQEVPVPIIPAGFSPNGFATATLDFDALTFSASLNWTGLTTPAIMAHIHRANAPSPTGPVILGFFMGTLLETSSFTGSGTLTTMQAATLAAGLGDGTLYFNVHTVLNPPGEIRGNIGAIPEPGSMFLMGAGLAAVAIASRRRSRVSRG